MSKYRAKLYFGDNLKALKKLPENSVHSVVTDPPYGLSKEPNILEMLSSWLEDKKYDHKSKGFMGNNWDSFVPQPKTWREVIRVLKPGGYCLAFFGTRTYDLGVLSMRLAGFEICNQIAWVYGSGFPKAQDISLAIDKELGKESSFVGKKARLTLKDKSKVNRKGKQQFHGTSSIKEEDIKEATSELGKKYKGWKTGIKPAFEPIVIARKPLSEKTYALNTIKHGVSGFNIDACRIGTQGATKKINPVKNSKTINTYGNSMNGGDVYFINKGRFPSNFIHDGSDEVIDLFPISNSARIGNKNNPKRGKNHSPTSYGKGNDKETHDFRDSGSAARFFYCAKTSKKDRDEDLDVLSDKQYTFFQTGGGSSGKASSISKERNTSYKNTHPTVKPTSLMAYLINLVTPEGGIVLDPFMGSGSTGKACMRENFKFIGIEMEQEYFHIAYLRVSAKNKFKTKRIRK